MDAAAQRTLESIERRVDELSRMMRREWMEAGRQRDLLGAELNALEAELALLRADLNDLRKRLDNDTRRPPKVARR